jgi:hypothetical protein
MSLPWRAKDKVQRPHGSLALSCSTCRAVKMPHGSLALSCSTRAEQKLHLLHVRMMGDRC